MKKTIISMVILLGSVVAHAKPEKALLDFTKEQVSRISTALNESPSTPEQQQTGDWDFRNFLLRIQAKAGFDIHLVKLELIPELELVWQKAK